MEDGGDYYPYSESDYSHRWQEIIARIGKYLDTRPMPPGSTFESTSYLADDGSIATRHKISFHSPEQQVHLIFYEVQQLEDGDGLEPATSCDTCEVEIVLATRERRHPQLIVQLDHCQATVTNPDEPSRREPLIGRRSLFAISPRLEPFRQFVPAGLDSAEAETLWLIDRFIPFLDV